MRIIDRRGEGIPVIISDTGKLSGMVPKYRLLDDSELMLTIPSAPIDDRKKLQQLVKGGMTPRLDNAKSDSVPINVPINKVADRDVPINVPIKETMAGKVLETIKRNPGINRERLAQELQVDVKTIGRALAALSGQVEHRGSKKTGGYYPV